MNLRYLPEGLRLLKVLCDRDDSLVRLVADSANTLHALKTTRLRPGGDSVAQKFLGHLGCLTQSTDSGLIPITRWGVEGDAAICWLLMPAADDAQPPDRSQVSVHELYTPLTLHYWIQQHGPLPFERVVELGLRMTSALETLHDAGWTTNRIRPERILIWKGQFYLGDCFSNHALICCPGRESDEYRPEQNPEATSADYFALGKTLYRAWTGCAAHEFPTLPRKVLGVDGWHRTGIRFNEVLLRCCSPSPEQRFATGKELRRQLVRAAAGERKINQRRWLLGTLTGLVLGGLGLQLTRRASPAGGRKPMVEWRLLKRWEHLPDGWAAHRVLTDPTQDRVVSFRSTKYRTMLFRLDISDLQITSHSFPGVALNSIAAAIIPGQDVVWAAEPSLETLHAFSIETPAHEQLGRAEPMPGHDGSEGYWNPLTKRFGVAFGSGEQTQQNGRWEWSGTSWTKVETSDPARHPGPRAYAQLLKRTDTQLLFCGGEEASLYSARNPNEDHSKTARRLPVCSQVWELDLRSGAWTAWAQELDLSSLYRPKFSFDQRTGWLFACDQSLRNTPIGTPPLVLVAQDKGSLRPATSVGDVPEGHGRVLLAYDEVRGRTLAFGEFGIYSLEIASA